MRGHRLALAAFVVVGAAALLVRSFGGGADLCAQLDDARADAATGFAGFAAGDVLFDGADACEFVTDPVSTRVGCTWEHELADTPVAWEQYGELVADVRSCLPAGVPEVADQSVNHPDAWESTTFEPAAAPGVSVAVKQKSQLRSVLVTLAVVTGADS